MSDRNAGNNATPYFDIFHWRWQVMAMAAIALFCVSVMSRLATGNAFLAEDDAGLIRQLMACLFGLGPAFAAILVVGHLRLPPKPLAGAAVFCMIWSLLLSLGLLGLAYSATSRDLAPALPPHGQVFVTGLEVVSAPLLCALLVAVVIGQRQVQADGHGHENRGRTLTMIADCLGGAAMFLWLVLLPGKLLA